MLSDLCETRCTRGASSSDRFIREENAITCGRRGWGRFLALSAWGEWERGGKGIISGWVPKTLQGFPGEGLAQWPRAQGKEEPADSAALRGVGEGLGSVERVVFEPEARLASWACDRSSCAESHIQKRSHTWD